MSAARRLEALALALSSAHTRDRHAMADGELGDSVSHDNNDKSDSVLLSSGRKIPFASHMGHVTCTHGMSLHLANHV